MFVCTSLIQFLVAKEPLNEVIETVLTNLNYKVLVMTIIIHWTLIVLPIFAVVVILIVLLLIVYLKKLTKDDLYKSKDGLVYRIVDL